jgi:hypothetical protein
MVTIVAISNNNSYTNNCNNNNNIDYSVNMFVVNNVLKTEHSLNPC